MIKRKIFFSLIIVILLFSVFFLFFNQKTYAKNLTIEIDNIGLYNVYFYDVNNNEFIKFNNIFTINRKINVNKEKLYNNNYERQFLIVVESNFHIGIGSYSLIQVDSTYEVRKEIYNIYINNYDTNSVEISLNKKKVLSKYEITENISKSKPIKILYNDKEELQISRGGFLINSLNEDNDVIGKVFVVNDKEIVYSKESNIHNTDIYQFFQINYVTLSNKNDNIKIIILSKFNGGILNFGADDEFIQYLNLTQFELDSEPYVGNL